MNRINASDKISFGKTTSRSDRNKPMITTPIIHLKDKTLSNFISFVSIIYLNNIWKEAERFNSFGFFNLKSSPNAL